jgi:hypothetical protein
MTSKHKLRILGASNHAEHERQADDFYATDPKCAADLLKILPELKDVWECACGAGHLAEPLGAVKATDLVDRGYGQSNIDFLLEHERWHGDIVTNPPYKLAIECVEKALSLINDGRYVCMFLKLQFLEGQARSAFFAEHPPKTVAVYSQRQRCAMNGDFDNYKSSALAYAWFIWQKGYQGKPEIIWIRGEDK